MNVRKARKLAGLPKFERECRVTWEGGRLKKAYRVPGTPEHGQHCMMLKLFNEYLHEEDN